MSRTTLHKKREKVEVKFGKQQDCIRSNEPRLEERILSASTYVTVDRQTSKDRESSKVTTSSCTNCSTRTTLASDRSMCQAMGEEMRNHGTNITRCMKEIPCNEPFRKTSVFFTDCNCFRQFTDLYCHSNVRGSKNNIDKETIVMISSRFFPKFEIVSVKTKGVLSETMELFTNFECWRTSMLTTQTSCKKIELILRRTIPTS
ncbi:unnamed protein product [Caenorhabditis brenneri]